MSDTEDLIPFLSENPRIPSPNFICSDSQSSKPSLSCESVASGEPIVVNATHRNMCGHTTNAEPEKRQSSRQRFSGAARDIRNSVIGLAKQLRRYVTDDTDNASCVSETETLVGINPTTTRSTENASSSRETTTNGHSVFEFRTTNRCDTGKPNPFPRSLVGGKIQEAFEMYRSKYPLQLDHGPTQSLFVYGTPECTDVLVYGTTVAEWIAWLSPSDRDEMKRAALTELKGVQWPSTESPHTNAQNTEDFMGSLTSRRFMVVRMVRYAFYLYLSKSSTLSRKQERSNRMSENAKWTKILILGVFVDAWMECLSPEEIQVLRRAAMKLLVSSTSAELRSQQLNTSSENVAERILSILGRFLQKYPRPYKTGVGASANVIGETEVEDAVDTGICIHLAMKTLPETTEDLTGEPRNSGRIAHTVSSSMPNTPHTGRTSSTEESAADTLRNIFEQIPRVRITNRTAESSDLNNSERVAEIRHTLKVGLDISDAVKHLAHDPVRAMEATFRLVNMVSEGVTGLAAESMKNGGKVKERRINTWRANRNK